MDTITLLSVSAGRHRLGYALFRDGQLYYYGLTTLKQFHTVPELKNAVEKFLAAITRRSQTKQIAVRRLNKQQRRNILLTAINDHIETYCAQNDLPITRYEGRFINEQYCRPNQRPTRDRTIQALLRKYPYLETCYGGKQQWQRQYYAHLFQAIAVGMVFLKEKRSNNGSAYVQ